MNATMRAVLWEGNLYNVTVANVPMPTIQNQTDAIVRVSSAGICGTDLHTYHGFSGSAEPPWVLGHEAIGYISEIGNSVEAHAVGDYVVIPDILPTGHLNLEPSTGDTYGVGPDRGDGGCQAEYVRVPYADQALIPVPPPDDNSTSRSKEIDYLFVSDIFATAWAGLTFSGFEAGDTVAVFGAGPVGLLAAYAARLRGASKVYVVDHVQRRLDLAAANVGGDTVVVPINFADADPVAAILAHEPAGVRRSVDCVGFEAVDRGLNNDEAVVVAWMVAVTGRQGGIGQVGIYRAQEDSPGRPLAGTVAGNVSFPSSDFFGKGLRFQSGPVDPKLLAPELVPLIASGTVDLSWIVSSEISIEDAPEYYGRFSRHEEEKFIIRF